MSAQNIMLYAITSTAFAVVGLIIAFFFANNAVFPMLMILGACYALAIPATAFVCGLLRASTFRETRILG